MAFSSDKVASSAVVQHGAALSSLIQRLPDLLQSYAETAIDQLSIAYSYIPPPAREYLDSAAKQLPLDSPAAIAATSLVIITAVVSMSRWGFDNWRERLSPFGARNSAPNVTEDDFSYITSQDLQNPDRTNDHLRRSPPTLSPEDDVLLCRHKGITYPLKFPAYTIGDGKLSVGDLRNRVAQAIEVTKAQRVKLLYKGQQLKDDQKSCRSYNLKNQSEIMAVVSEPIDESESDEENNEAGKKKRVRNRKGKKKGGKSDPKFSPGSGTSRTASPIPSAGPKGPKEKLQEISNYFQSEIMPLVDDFMTHPPTEQKKRDFEKLKLDETIMREVMLKLDAVETEGNPDIRQMRKDLVKTAQDTLNELDQFAGMRAS